MYVCICITFVQYVAYESYDSPARMAMGAVSTSLPPNVLGVL